MKKQWFVFSLVAWFAVFALTSLTTNKEGKYYYAFDEKTLLISQENTLLVKFTKEEFDRVNMENFLKESVTGIQIKWHNPFVVEISAESLKTIEDLKLKLKSQENITSCQPFYKSEDGVDMGVTDVILIRFLPDVSNKQQKELYNKFNTEVIKKTKIYQKLICPKGSDALDIANAYFETGLVEFSTPDFISYAEFYQTIPNDTYFGNQITCHNTGQTFNDGHSGTSDADIDAPEAWEITTGCNDVIIAVLDQGVTSNHYDLPNTRQVRLSGSDFTGDDDNPSPVGNENHGNACAGVIAATMNNNQGIAGIAPNCRIMPIRMMDVGPSIVADAIEFAVDNGADILSNSWGYGSSNPNLFPVIVTAINYAINNNRVVIFAAGNTADHDNNEDGYVTFPANVNITGVITVGASDRYDNQANYSPTSNLIDIAAPSNRSMPWQDIEGETYEMWSIDIPGNAGYNTWHGPYTPPNIGEVLPNSGTNHLWYTGRFGGTSHSCPVVAGVAALVLSVDQSLTYLEVFDILTTTADEVGGYTYTNGFSEELGSGRVNAHRAVLEVCGIMSVTGPSIVCTSNANFILHDAPPGANVTWAANPYLVTPSSGDGTSAWIHATCNDIGNTTITFTISHECIGISIQVEKEFLVAGPDYSEVELDVTYSTGQPAPKSGSIFLLCPYTYYYFYVINNSDCSTSGYKWTFPPSITLIYTNNNMAYVYTGSNPGGNVRVKATTCCSGCGSNMLILSDYVGTYWNCGGYYYAMSPNPADDCVEISLDENKVDLSNILEYEVKIYNNQQVLVSNVKTKKPFLQFDTSQFKNGIYYVHLIYDGKTFVQQLVISH